MYLKRFRSADVRDALRAARHELGPEALVLSTEMVPVRGWRGLLGIREVEITAAAERDLSGPRQPASEERRVVSDPSGAEVAARLVAGGLDGLTAAEIAAAIPQKARRSASLHSLRAAVANRLSMLAAADADFAPIEVFIGPPGAGKTTTIAKIASQERGRGGRRLGLVAADGFRVGAVEQLRTYAEVLGAPFQVARSAEDLGRELARPHRLPVLVDTAGRSPSDASARELFQIVARTPGVRTHLVMPAGTSVQAARRIFDAYADARPTRLVLSKVDEAESLSPLVGLLRERRLPISYLGLGQRVPEDLALATSELLAASILGEAEPRAMHS
jgi:flagellar biosynthesis protein FlhF